MRRSRNAAGRGKGGGSSCSRGRKHQHQQNARSCCSEQSTRVGNNITNFRPPTTTPLSHARQLPTTPTMLPSTPGGLEGPECCKARACGRMCVGGVAWGCGAEAFCSACLRSPRSLSAVGHVPLRCATACRLEMPACRHCYWYCSAPPFATGSGRRRRSEAWLGACCTGTALHCSLLNTDTPRRKRTCTNAVAQHQNKRVYCALHRVMDTHPAPWM
jgi:hypothetical protein